MNQFERVEQLLGQVTYKPGYVLYCLAREDFGLRGVTIVCQGQFQSLTRDGTKVSIANQATILDATLVTMTDHDILLHCIGRALIELETHEVDEWFCFNGTHVVDPHPERKKP